MQHPGCSRKHHRGGFTLIELMIVVTIIGILASAIGVTIVNMGESAREAQTLATLNKVDGLISARRQGVVRATRSVSFRRLVRELHRAIDTGSRRPEVPYIPGFSKSATEILAIKLSMRAAFPQFLGEVIDPTDSGGTRVVDRIINDADLTFDNAKHTPDTESSEVLYYALTSMEVYGFPPVSTDSFSTNEVQDTDGDGLLEFVDGWRQPLRFYRSPTRLIKPYGALGPDNVPGNPGNDDAALENAAGNTPLAESLSEMGYRHPTSGVYSDDLLIRNEWRQFAALFISGLPRAPSLPGQYDTLNEDPDDPYGLLVQQFSILNARSPGSSNSVMTVQAFANLELGLFPTFDTFHTPLVVSAGPDGQLGILEPFPTEDRDGDGTLDAGEDLNGNGQIDLFGHLAIPELNVQPNDIPGDPPSPRSPAPSAPYITTAAFEAAADNITNLNRAAGN